MKGKQQDLPNRQDFLAAFAERTIRRGEMRGVQEIVERDAADLAKES